MIPASPPLPPFFAGPHTIFVKKNASLNSEASKFYSCDGPKKGGEPGEGGGPKSPAIQNYLLNKLLTIRRNKMAIKKVTDSKLEMTEVLNCYRVKTKLYVEVQQHMFKQLNKVLRTRHYTLRQMCNKEFWISLEIPDRRDAGRAFAFMVHSSIFSFKFINTKKSAPKRYLLK